MYQAINKHGDSVSVDDTYEGEKCICPTCKQEVVARRGEIKRHHFAHKPGCPCIDNWAHEISE